MFTKERLLVHQYIGVFVVFVATFTYPLLILNDQTYWDKIAGIWPFFREIFAVLFLTLPIAWLDVILKQKRGTVFDALFYVGLSGVFFCAIYSLGYLLVNCISISTTVVFAQYMAAVFGSAANFFLTLSRLLVTGLIFTLLFTMAKYSSSL